MSEKGPAKLCLFVHWDVEVACLRFYVMGFRGDWKAFRQVFNLDRHYNTDEASSIKKWFGCLMFPMFFWSATFTFNNGPPNIPKLCFEVSLENHPEDMLDLSGFERSI